MRLHMKEERLRAGLSAKEAAEKIGVHENALLRWEAGTAEPMGSNLVKLASLYGCAPEYLLGVTDDRTGRVIARCNDERT